MKSNELRFKGGQVTNDKKKGHVHFFKLRFSLQIHFQAHYGVNKNTDDGQEAWPKAPDLYRGYYIASY